MSPKGSFERTATAIVTICIVAVTLMIARREVRRTPPTERGAAPVFIKNWRKLATGSVRLGPPTAPVTIIEFADFQCPFCKAHDAALANVAAKRPGMISVYFRHLPLAQLHPYARAAAIASECAAAQGRFIQYHDYLFAHQDSIGHVTWADVAAAVGVPDRSSFDRCVESEIPAQRLAKDSAAAVEIRTRGTPTFLINGRWFTGARSAAALDSIIVEELAKERTVR